MRYLLLVLAALGIAATPAGAQNPVPLDTLVHNFQLPRQLPECGLEAVLMRVAKETGVRIGFERTSDCHGHRAFGFPEILKPLSLVNAEVLDGVQVKDVLSRIAALVPDYDWAIMEDVAVFRPSAAWKDTADALGARVPRMHFVDAPAIHVVGAMLSRQLPGDAGKGILSIDFPGGTLLDALNSLVRSQPAMWYASTDGQELHVSVMNVPSGSGLSVTMPIPALLNRGTPSF
jgi:hypothetical protein